MTASLGEIAQLFKTSSAVLLATHIAPDPDAIGSSGALALGLTKLGQKATVYLKDPVPLRMSEFVAGISYIHSPPQGMKFDLLVILDTAGKKRVGEDVETLFSQAAVVVNLDHHISNEKFGHFAYVDPEEPATVGIVFKLLQLLSITGDPQIANLLYAGLLDDTGSFRFSNTSVAAFELGASMLRWGAEPEKVANRLYFSVPRRVIELRARAMSEMRLIAGGRVAVVVVSKEMLTGCGATSEDTEGIVDEARAIEGTVASCLIREIDDGWKVSLRSKNSGLDVNAIAGVFGGGGHKAASGCRINGGLSDVEGKLFPLLENAALALSL